MKRSLVILSSAMLGLALSAQEGPGGAPPSGEGRPPMMKYDISREVTLKGTVTAITLATHGPGTFVSLTLQTDSAATEIMVGPESVLNQKGFTFAKGDALTAVGVAVAGPQGSMFLARTITRGDATLTLLDQDGRPTGRP